VQRELSFSAHPLCGLLYVVCFEQLASKKQSGKMNICVTDESIKGFPIPIFSVSPSPWMQGFSYTHIRTRQFSHFPFSIHRSNLAIHTGIFAVCLKNDFREKENSHHCIS